MIVIVDQGDTLSEIAKFYTGNADNWRLLAHANGIRIPWDDTRQMVEIQPGQRIIIPEENQKGVLRPPPRPAR